MKRKKTEKRTGKIIAPQCNRGETLFDEKLFYVQCLNRF